MRMPSLYGVVASISFFVIPVCTWANDAAEDQRQFRPMDVFQLEFAGDPRISPDGKRVVYVRNFMDVMKDQVRSSLWTIDVDGARHRALTDGNSRETQPRWSPSGDRLLYVSTRDGASQLYLRWMDTGQSARLTQLVRSPSSLSWSPDGKWIAFSMLVPQKPESFAEIPGKPKGAEWAEPAKVINKMKYRADGAGYVEDGFHQLFVLPSDGGTPRQLTFGEFHHQSSIAWAPDSKSVVFSANRRDKWELDPLESELYRLQLDSGAIVQLTDRKGPDYQPTLSADGRWLAYVGFDDQLQGHHTVQLYLRDLQNDKVRRLTAILDRSVGQPKFSADSKRVYFQYDDQGVTKIAQATLDGKLTVRATNVGGLALGRPYPAGGFTVSTNDRIAYTHTRPDHPADVALATRNVLEDNRLTRLNDDLFGHKKLATMETMWFVSSADGRRVQAWILKPAGFSAKKKYPLILEIHGGPFANYGERFSAEMQLYASAGYVVLYVNPRGSTSYGHEFANLIHHNYPGQDYDDLMSAVDELLKKGYVDREQLFVTGGSGGGVLSAWIIGKTNRFRAAVVAKPVINWYSFALTADAYGFFYKYWFADAPWKNAKEYMRRSPISLVGNVNTPTMLLTGEEDYRTPISESEQFYQALQLREVDSMLVRIPGASHSITARPSRLITKVAHVLAWFERAKESSSSAK